MQFSVSIFYATLALILSLVGAIPQPQESGSGSCSSGALQCCNSVQNADSKDVENVFNLFGSTASGLTGQVGLACSPLVDGTSGAVSCSQQAACCDDAQFNGFVATGCSPLNLGGIA